MRKIDLTGQRFGRLLVLEKDESRKDRSFGFVNVIAEIKFQFIEII